MKKTHVLSLLLFSFISTAIQAAVINFDDLNVANYSAVPTNYADHGLNGNGDVHVAVAYSGNTGNTNYLSFWDNDYGDLYKVAYTPTNGGVARITLTADAGWQIDSIAFDLAGYSQQDRISDVTYALGSDITNLPGQLILGSGPAHSHFSKTGTSTQTAYIEWGTDWNVSIDNIVFNVVQTGSVPEPGTLLLILTGLVFFSRSAVSSRTLGC